MYICLKSWSLNLFNDCAASHLPSRPPNSLIEWVYWQNTTLWLIYSTSKEKRQFPKNHLSSFNKKSAAQKCTLFADSPLVATVYLYYAEQTKSRKSRLFSTTVKISLSISDHLFDCRLRHNACIISRIYFGRSAEKERATITSRCRKSKRNKIANLLAMICSPFSVVLWRRLSRMCGSYVWKCDNRSRG